MTQPPTHDDIVGQARGVTVRRTAIPGLLVADLDLHADQRGWFKENWHRAAMTAAGLPDFGPVQQSISFNTAAGTTRGIHAEPWDKLVSVGAGAFFGAWVDLREGPGFGTVFTAEVTPSRAVFVPRGVGNSFQTTADATVYSYLVNDHWSPDAQYSMVNLADPTLAIAWPIPLDRAICSDKDRAHPPLGAARPIPPRKTLVVGAYGQLGRALRALLGDGPHLEYVDIDTFDMSAPEIAGARHWRDYDTVINAAAYTAVDKAETPQGRQAAWAANVTGVANLARIATDAGITLAHVSSDYVFDGTSTDPYREDHPVAPLGVYAQTKAAGDAIVSGVPRHYIVRASWVIGEGKNFVRTMADLAARGIAPRVVADQRGRLTFTDDLAAGIVHLVQNRAPYGLYNLTSRGQTHSWAEIAARVFQLVGADPARVTPVTTADYYAGAAGPIAPRPANSTLNLEKILATGFTPHDGDARLEAFVAALRGR
ncbi:MAG: bifunctional dTDP-4-dehydrorhamnose 3,5-epimerase family protein/NAD(P)-dependent oxidoreductase [Bifidobacteriaceae bacterium]|jgi:dTDP-4-dehydrorhamnose 3,5-epimerase|nr:bifunctional dTDP-4-dehydrorhamnose 3,5-epimerase family protein/NAD(P)-dependent oxidoreductase [Bifidobacteriaceae bacterium]